MTTTRLWDAKFLNERERDARESAVWRLAESDWKRALAEADRIRSNNGRRYRLCQNAACRRACNCVLDTPNCLKPASNEASGSPLVDHLYAKLQTARRDAAKAENNKGARCRQASHATPCAGLNPAKQKDCRARRCEDK